MITKAPLLAAGVALVLVGLVVAVWPTSEEAPSRVGADWGLGVGLILVGVALAYAGHLRRRGGRRA